MIIARVPLFFFQAIQAALLPALAAQAAAGRFAEFRHGFLRLFGLVGAVAALAVLANLAIGPVVVGVLFGGGNTLTRVDLALLAAGSGVYMLALALAQALIALEGHALVVVGWLAGVLGFVVVLAAAASAGLFLRVELALVTASLGAAAVMGAMLLRRLAVHAPAAA